MALKVLRDDVAASVGGERFLREIQLAAKLSHPHILPLYDAGKATTAEVEAFELVAKGRALQLQRGRSLLVARECFEAAIRLDPDNADAYALLGETLVNFVRYGLMPVSMGHPLAKAALTRALELEPNHNEAMGAQALVSLFFEHAPSAAFDWWERAVADDPLSASVAGFSSGLLAITGHTAAARTEAKRAQALDADSFTAAYGRVIALIVSDDPEDVRAAITAANEALAKFGRHPLFISFLVLAYLNNGDARRAEAAYAELQARAEIDTVQRSALANAACYLGRHDEAIDYALESVERCDALNPFWARLPFATDAIRAHPRYPELLRAMGL